MSIKRMPVQIQNIEEISPTVREVHLALPNPLDFLPGAFVNVFMSVNGVRTRRAYSISSSPTHQTEIALSIRKGTPAGMSAQFFKEGIEHEPLEIMGPLGLNTLDKITRPHVFLFGFGIGASVVKGMLHGLLDRADVQSITVVTGNRTEDEILYKDFFEDVAARDARVSTRFVVSRPTDSQYPWKGYIQNNVHGFEFNNSSVYICGTGSMCTDLRTVIENSTTEAPQFLIEAFD